MSGTHIKPDPTDPRNLQNRLMNSGTPINRGIAALISAPSIVAGYSCQGCGHQKELNPPIRMTRDDVRAALCGACGSGRITLNLRGAV